MPLPPPPPPSPDPSDIDWDDDDEVTTLFSKEEHGSPEDRLLSDGPPTARPYQRPLAPPAPRKPPKSVPPPAPPPPPPSVSVRPEPRKSNSLVWLAIGGGVVLVVFIVSLLVFMPGKGEMVINVAGPGGIEVDQVSLRVDGVEVCDYSPCQVKELTVGTHTVSIDAPGYQKHAGKAVQVKGQDPTIVNFDLRLPDGATTPAGTTTGTGLQVGKLPKGMHLFVDDKDRGAPPVTVNDLKPGQHTVKLSGNDRYETWSDTVDLVEGTIKQIEPELVLLKGVLEIKAGAGAEGADITLECGRDRRELEPGKKVMIDVDNKCSVKAKRAGYTSYSKQVSFSVEEPKLVLTVSLYKVGSGRPVEPATDPKEEPPAATMGTLSVNSIPLSSVIVDGVPWGQTPKSRSVPPGPHVVVFIHKDNGTRKTVRVTVGPGESKVAAVRF